MSNAYIYNGFGHYETRDGEEGMYLPYAGMQFWLPYQKVTPITNFALREVDHDKTTPERGEIATHVTYKNEFVDGKRLAEELTTKQVPITNHDKGIQIIEGKPTGNSVVIFGGCSADNGAPIMVEVLEKVATKAEIERAEQASLEYKHLVIAEFFESKRNRATGGQGRNTPDKITRIYMEELNVEDNDDVTAHQKAAGGIDYEMVRVIIEETRKAAAVNAVSLHEAVESVRKKGKAQLSSNQVGARRKSLNLAQKKAERDAAAAQVEEPVKTEA